MSEEIQTVPPLRYGKRIQIDTGPGAVTLRVWTATEVHMVNLTAREARRLGEDLFDLARSIMAHPAYRDLPEDRK